MKSTIWKYWCVEIETAVKEASARGEFETSIRLDHPLPVAFVEKLDAAHQHLEIKFRGKQKPDYSYSSLAISWWNAFRE